MDAASLRIGDVILVRPGERIAADGQVLSGSSDVDQATITGEPLPAAKNPGDEVFASTSNGTGALRARVLLRRGRVLEGITLGWNVAGVVVLAMAAVAARSVALAGFGLDSLIEIGASTVVLWELAGVGEERQRRALRCTRRMIPA